ncbi:hypothetical protein [Oceanobacillus sp. CF4.6]
MDNEEFERLKSILKD